MPVAVSDEKLSYKLRFPSTGAGISKYLLFTEAGSLMIETEDYKRPYDERYTWLEPEDTIKFLDSVGEVGRRPEFVDGEPTPETKVMLRRLMKQFGSVADLSRCWKIIGIQGQSFYVSESSE